MDKKAEVDVVIGGADKVKQDLAGIADATRKVGDSGRSASKVWGEIGRSIGSSLQTLSSDFMRLVSVGSLLNFRDAIGGARVFGETAQRLSTATGASFETIRKRTDEVGRSIGVTREQSLAWEQAVLRSTRSVQFAGDSMRAFQEQALASGETLQDQVPLAKVLRDAFHIENNTGATQFFERLTAQAKELGTIGGPAALKDQIVALGPALEQVSLRTQKAKDDMTGFLAGVGAKTQSPAQANRVTQTLLGTIEGRAADISARLGIPLDQLLDEQGHVKNVPEVLSKISKQGKERFGKNAYRAFINTFGSEAGTFLFNNDPADLAAAASGAKPEAGTATKNFMASEAGRTLGADIDAERRNQENAKHALGVERFMKEHPILSTLGTMVGSDVVRSLLKTGGVGAAAKGVGAAVSTGGAIAGIGTLLAAAGAGLGMGAGLSDFMDLPEARQKFEGASRIAFDRQRQGQAHRVVDMIQGSDSVPEFLRRANTAGFGSVFSQQDLKGAADAASTGQIPAGLDQALAKALAQAFKTAGVQFTVVVQNQSDSPIQATVKEQAKAGQQ